MLKFFLCQKIKKILLSTFLTLLLGSYAYAQKSYAVTFQDKSIEMPENINSFQWNQMAPSNKYNNGYFGWVQFYKTPDQQTQDYFTSNKLELLEYISNGTYLFYFPESTSISVLKSKGVRAILPLSGAYKMSKSLKEGAYESWAIEGNNILVTLQFYKNVDVNNATKDLMNLKIRVKQQYQNSNTIELSVPKSNLVELSNLPYVKYIELIAAPAVPEDTRGRNLHRSSSLDTQTGIGRNYTGAGIGVMVRDDGIVGPHIDFQGRIDNSATSDMTGNHGDGVAGIMAGAGNLDPSMRGMAAGSDVYVVNYASSFLDAATQTLINTGVVQITNSSYGNGQNDGYTTTAQTVDQQTHTIPSLLHVFSAGNSGTSDFGYGAGTGWGNITGGHKQGKNVIATANVFFDGSLVNSSSRGPASDGRIKPDIAANGQNQNSTDTNNLYRSFGGTSGAAPGIAGVSAQLYEAYGNLNSGALPESALIKATLLNTANEAGNTGPDYKFGWGIVNGLRAGKLIEDGHYLKSTVSQAVSNNHSINIPAGTTQVRFMVYWSDVAAAAGATTALINDLDLVVTAPSAASYLPWILDPRPNAINLDLPATNGIDRLNNMEQVLLNTPAAGNYNINITGFNVPMGPQEYYVVYEIITEELTLTYPNGGESLAPGETESIHWDAINTSTDFTLEYSTDAGVSWNPITTVASTITNYTWSVPASVTANAIIRITSGSFSDTSDARFSIASLTSNVQVIQVCPNTASFSWTPVAGADSYDIYLLGSTSMELAGNSTLSSITVPITDYLSPIWAAVVAKNGAQGWKSRRTIAINHPGGLLNCSLTNDLSVLSIQNTDEDFLETGCLGAPDNIISATLQNLGTNPQSNFMVSYQLDSNPAVQETYSGTLVNGQQVLYNFTTPLTIPSNGNHTLTVSVVITGDQNQINNSVQFNFEADIDGVPELICKNTTIWLDGAGNASITPPDVTDNLGFVGYAQQGTTYDPVSITGTTVNLGDDTGTRALPIGFDFDFFGSDYSQFYIASNGFISFTGNGMTGANSYVPTSIPNADAPNGMIALVWDDLSPNISGTISYETLGTAPNRKLIVNYDAVPLYNNAAIVTAQLQLYEGTSTIEIHTTNAQNNGGNRTQGLENAAGDSAFVTIGRNLTSWVASNEAIQFTQIAGDLPDNCGNPVALSLSQSSFTSADIGDNTIVVTADDGNGGISTCQAIVTVLRDPINFIWETGSWTPQDPSGFSTFLDTIEVRSPAGALTANTSVGTLNILSNGVLDMGANELTLTGDFASSGIFNANDATLLTNGVAEQQVTGDFQVGDLVINNTSTDGVSLFSNVEVMNRLDLINGILNTTVGGLVLNSDATHTAMVDQVLAGSIIGEVTVERYIPSKRAFRLLTSAVSTTTSINYNWQEGVHNTTAMSNINPIPDFGTHITGANTGANGFDATSTGNESLFTYDNLSQVWETVTNTNTNTLAAGKAYRLLVRGSRAVDLNSNTAVPDHTTIRATGTLETGDVSVSNLGVTNGAFNFIGNPYQASVDMSLVLAASTNLNGNFYYVWDPQIGVRGAYVTVSLPAGLNTSGSAANKFMQPGQATFVNTLSNGAGNVLFQEVHKAVGQNTATFRSPSNNSSIIGQLFRYQNGAVTNGLQDSFGIFFSSTANTGVDSFDAIKLPNQDETVAVQYGSDLLAIDNRQLPVINETILLNHDTYRTTNYQYKIVINDVIGKQIFLEDSFLGITTLLNDGVNLYDFTIDSNTASSDANRFSLKIENQTLGLDGNESGRSMVMSPNPVTSDVAQISISGVDMEPKAQALVYNLAGQILLEFSLDFSNGSSQIEGLSRLASGVYFLRMKSDQVSQAIKFIKR
jgi:hypothetical protein